MEVALGKMAMPPHIFWDMSFPEFYAAITGFTEFHSDGTPPPMTKDELEDLMERYPD